MQEALAELCMAHEVVSVPDSARPLPPGTSPPLLVDGAEAFEGATAIFAHLRYLEGFKAEWDRFQTDACYCGPDDEVE